MSRTKNVNLYAELKKGTQEMVGNERSEQEPARLHRFAPSENIRALREKAGGSQRAFAPMLGVSIRTL